MRVTSLHQLVRRTMARHALTPPGSRVLVALSGGADSVTLARVLRDLAPRDGFMLAGLAHFNHRLRPTADSDEAFCRALARELDLPLVVERADVPAAVAMERRSVEVVARRLRYLFLERARVASGADRIAVGHTQDDQAETVLLKLARGAGATGLGAVYPRRGRIVRPLLDVSRARVEAFLRRGGHAWCEDETNRQLDNPRNRIRHVVLPELDRAYGGPTRPAIARAAALVREDAEWLDALAAACLARIGQPAGEGLTIDVAVLMAEPLPIRRRVVRLALRHVAGRREVGRVHVEAALSALGSAATGGIDLPGGRLELRDGKLVLQDRASTGMEAPAAGTDQSFRPRRGGRR